MTLTTNDVYLLGRAVGNFDNGNIDAGIHIVLPVWDEEGRSHNDQFTDLISEFLKIIERTDADAYIGAVQRFARENGLDFGDNFIDVH